MKTTILLFLAALASSRALAQSPLPNGSFEDVAGTSPAHWTPASWGGEGVQSIADSGRTGARSVSISSAKGADIAWSTTVPVEMASRYRLEGWIRTSDVRTVGGAAGALLNIHNIQTVRTNAVTGTSEWTRVQAEFDTGFNDSVTINCLLGGWGLATGQAWYDDVSLTLLAKGTLPPPRITVDAAVTGEPISKYIYGQFIEHLGRCIYGGIWAEVLDDRKFYHAVSAPESPWRSVGSPAAVSMTTEGPFVGAHTPVIKVDGARTGISQNIGGLRDGVGYLGYIWLAGDASAAPITVSITPAGAGRSPITVSIPAISRDFTRQPLEFPASAGASGATIEITSSGKGTFRVGTVSLMPADNIEGFRKDTLALLKRLDSPVYRWPGGNFVSGYDWRDGIGDRDRRPPRKNPAWTGVEHNDVGVHEFLRLCELLSTEPYIAVNTGLGSVDNAVAELEYVNGAADSPMGSKRAANGRRDPWKVRFWGIGNEMYGSWQLGNVPLSEYTRRHNTYVDAMRKVDPTITAIAVGAAGEWSRTMLRDCADRTDLMSEHVYWQGRDSVLAHVKQAPDSLRAIADAHRAYRRDLPNLKGRDIRICQDEWNYWYGPDIFGELGTRYFLKDALGCAAALNEFGRNSDLFFMANYAQTVNVIGAIKTTPTTAAMETTGLVLELYRHHLGTVPCRTETSPLIDALAAWSADRKSLTIAVVNPSSAAAAIPLELRGATLAGTGIRREISHPNAMIYNDPEKGSPVSIRETPLTGIQGTLSVEACSISLFTLDTK
jgi:alpha-N-arabinofuranosidase